jgi:aminobenzoyl-glutamate utilization protein B
MRFLFIALFVAQTAFAAPRFAEVKKAANDSIDRNAAEMTALSDQIWRYAELALRETRSSKALADWAETKGFRVTRGGAGMPTACVAEFGSGKPVIGIMGEFDALPGISQKAQPTKDALEEGAPGHGCGHNLFGVGSLGAALAVKEQIAAGTLRGTVRFFGTPAEEAVGGKVYMLRDGVFRDVDVMLAWHPSDETQSDAKSTQAVVIVHVEFRGRSAHAAYDPWNARSAADGAELFTFGVNLLREHIRPSSRLHYTVREAGKAPNVVPDYANVEIWMRDEKREEVDRLLGRIREIAQGAAMAAGVTSAVTVDGGSWNMLINMPGQKAAFENMQSLGPVPFTEDEQRFAKTIQKETGAAERGLLGALKPLETNPGPADGGSSDVGDVSWVVPTIHISATTAPIGAPWHGWPIVACGGMSIGHKGMLWASKALARTMIDLYRDPKLIESVRAEFAKQTAGVTYKPYIPPGPPPVPAP